MNIILLDKIANLGGLGDQVTVKSGYARNFLFPQGKAVPATKDNVEKFEARRAELEAKIAEQLAAANARAEKVAELAEVTIAAPAGDEGKLFGSVGTRDIADAITAAGVEVEKAEVKLYNLSSTGEANQDFKKFSMSLVEAINSAESAYKREGQLSGIPTGFTDLDQLLGGFHKTDLLILAGRPSMGKTALATNIAFKMVNARSMDDENKKNVIGFFSLEMSSEQLATRILAEDSSISSEKIRRGQFNSNDFQKIVKSSQTLSDLALYIDDSPNLSISALRTRARRLKRKYGLDIIVIDYLQLIRPTLNRPDNRVLEIAEMTRNLKSLAKELNIPVLCLSQLSRQVEQRDDKRPQLSDLRESGAIEQDADVVMFIYREEYYTERKEPSPGTEDYQKWQEKMSKIHNVAEVLVSKQRHGPIGKVNLHFEGSTTKFSNLSKNQSIANKE